MSLAYVRRSLGLIRAPAADVADHYAAWLNGILGPAGIRMEARSVGGGFDRALAHLLPVVTPPTKALFASCEGQWTAVFGNSHFGADAGNIKVLAEKVGATAMRVVAVPHTMPDGDYGAVIWEVYKPDHTVRRSLSAVNDGGRWEFYSQGEPFAFETTDRYAARRVRDRFTIEMLEDYLSHMNAFPFRDDWFLPEGAILVERIAGYLSAELGNSTRH